MEEKISIQREDVLNAYHKATEEQKALPENMFGKEMFQPKEIFPELKESDDEKIRKWIIDDIRYNINNEPLNNSEYKKKAEKAIAWLENQRDKDKLIQELGEYKVKYTQEVLEKYINSLSNKDDERLRKTAIDFLKDFAEQGYENAVECIDWLEKQGEEYIVSSDKPTWIPSTEHPAIDEEVIALVGEYKMIYFAHIVDKNIAIDYDGWNIPEVKCWIPCPKIEED